MRGFGFEFDWYDVYLIALIGVVLYLYFGYVLKFWGSFLAPILNPIFGFFGIKFPSDSGGAGGGNTVIYTKPLDKSETEDLYFYKPTNNSTVVDNKDSTRLVRHDDSSGKNNKVVPLPVKVDLVEGEYRPVRDYFTAIPFPTSFTGPTTGGSKCDSVSGDNRYDMRLSRMPSDRFGCVYPTMYTSADWDCFGSDLQHETMRDTYRTAYSMFSICANRVNPGHRPNAPYGALYEGPF